MRFVSRWIAHPVDVNLSAGCSPLPLHILEKCAAEFVNYIGRDGKERGLSIAEMGYRTNDFYELMDDAGMLLRTG